VILKLRPLGLRFHCVVEPIGRQLWPQGDRLLVFDCDAVDLHISIQQLKALGTKKSVYFLGWVCQVLHSDADQVQLGSVASRTATVILVKTVVTNVLLVVIVVLWRALTKPYVSGKAPCKHSQARPCTICCRDRRMLVGSSCPCSGRSQPAPTQQTGQCWTASCTPAPWRCTGRWCQWAGSHNCSHVYWRIAEQMLKEQQHSSIHGTRL